MKPFKRVILFARSYRMNAHINETLERVKTYLQNIQVDVCVDAETAHHFALDLPVITPLEMRSHHDLIVVVGGDGSLLSAARMAVRVGVPVTGISRGHLGFLTDISPQEIETQLGPLLEGAYQEEERFLLQTEVYDKAHVVFTGDSLNDIVLSRGTETHLIEFDVYIDEQFVSHYRADGLIISTPTGSTAYALSAGGPILHPGLNAIVLVPMFPHSLSSRPLVFHGDCKVRIEMTNAHQEEMQISCDSHSSQIIKPHEQIKIQKHPQSLRLLHPSEYNYYDTLRMKLGWGARPKG